MTGAHDDWPAAGEPLDLVRHESPHESSGIEWWYLNAHLRDDAGQETTLAAAFFRFAWRDAGTGSIRRGHAVHWTVGSAARSGGTSRAFLDDGAAAGLRESIRTTGSLDPYVRRAMLPLIEDGRVLLPDLPLPGPVRIAEDRLALRYADVASLESAGPGVYDLRLRHGDDPEITLRLHARKQAHRYGDDGIVPGRRGDGADAMFYYSVTRLDVSGAITPAGTAGGRAVTGTAWYDHEFGGPIQAPGSATGGATTAWEWTSIHLDDGRDLSLYDLWNVVGTNRTSAHSSSLFVDSAGDPMRLAAHRLTVDRVWVSTATFNEYPVRWRYEWPGGDILEITAVGDDHEVRSVTAGFSRGYWEGPVTVTGRLGGEPVHGEGFCETKPATRLTSIESFLAQVGKEVRVQVRELYPDQVDADFIASFADVDPDDDRLRSVDTDAAVRSLIAPVRHITDQPGKSWRSFLMFAAIDACGRLDEEHRPLLGACELLHTGSLIIDDVEDASATRRGVPAAHLRYGIAHAVNSGTAAYFAFDHVLRGMTRTDAQTTARVQRLFLGALRAAHTGQALDLADPTGGLDPAAPHADRILATHWLKTGVPAGAFARIGALLGGGTEDQQRALGRLGEAIGVGYQIADDVLDLTGILGRTEGSDIEYLWRAAGDDLKNGKLTYPVAVALARTGAAGKAEILRLLGPDADRADALDRLADIINGCGAVEESLRRAADIIDRAWDTSQAALRDSDIKAMVRAFSWYAVERAAPGSSVREVA
ncbi:geranylgeranyl pyrophosphate synthase/predicted secreted hydrolase [Allocatelliglobosispora scoriae]|uniref:Geranylgeranyl pyrophosphate synthase/predicted secreted hydrolase n=1 Tax=Allocatelliglobosispora scoriae TaxID=643052 RepID=A0A841BK13_9ACTN|nr:polyprenyl synthetase family protein [Allocatelliglobosispora scoriae]MBB5867231.1 geranylgeranyl pyrophosphate synthase/predicted secreted hydrolase [Allocatelliglobosispora scoriae]